MTETGKFQLSEDAIETCFNHLKSSGAISTEIETYLVRFLLVLICSEFEKSILNLTMQRIKKCGDPQVFNFVNEKIDQQFRRLRTGEMTDLLKRFDKPLGDKFSAMVPSEMVAAFDNIVNNRHDFAHGKLSINMTFDNLKDNFQQAKKVINSYSNILGLDEHSDQNGVSPLGSESITTTS